MSAPQTIGDTVYLTCQFLDIDGQPFDAENVSLEIFDLKWRRQGDIITNLAAQKTGAGAYSYPFLNPDQDGVIYRYTGYYNGIKNVVVDSYPLTRGA